MEYWYTEQLRNYRLQFIRAFSNFYYKTGKNADGTDALVRVPCRYGDPTRIAEMVVRGNSENKLLTVPFLTCHISGMSMSANRRQAPQYTERIQVDERSYDEDNQQYDNTPGNRYTIERYMPVPYTMAMAVDLWSNNESVKEQIIEQIMVLYNPAIEIQTSNNPLDWTVLSYIELQDNIAWSSRSIPIGTENPIDVLTMTFNFPIWINPPAKVKKQQIIENIIATMIAADPKDPSIVEWTDAEFLNRKTWSPGDYSIELAWQGDNTYALSLTSRAGNPVDYSNQATVTFSSVNPVLQPGTSFIFNGITLQVNTSNIVSFVEQAATQMVGTSYNIQIQNLNQIMFINNTGQNNVFSNAVGAPLEQLGLLPTTYPGGNLAWWRLLLTYGNLQTYSKVGVNASQLRVSITLDTNTYQATGWLDQHPTNQNLLLWRMDQQSLPATTLPAINAIVNPMEKGPNAGLPGSEVGQRYLLTEKPAITSVAWGNLVAEADDIIEFNGTTWAVTFNAATYNGKINYVTNLFTGKLLIWDGIQWSEYILPAYRPAYWRLAL
jgi:hypothetical protein